MAQTNDQATNLLAKDLESGTSGGVLEDTKQVKSSQVKNNSEVDKASISNSEFINWTCYRSYAQEIAGSINIFNTTVLKAEYSNLVIEVSKLNPHLSRYGIDLEKDADLFGSDGLVKINTLKSVPAMSPFYNPSIKPSFVSTANKQELVNARGVKLLQDIEYDLVMPRASIDNITKNLVSAGYLTDKQAKDLTDSVEADCSEGVKSLTNFFAPEVVIKGDPGEGLPITNYNAGMTNRRPAGHYMCVDIVDKHGNRKDIIGMNGRVISALKLNTSPDALSINSAKIVNRFQTLTRWVEEHWGEEMDQVTWSGNTFAFINTVSDEGRGLSVQSRDLTSPYQELRHFADVAMNNGCVYQPDRIEEGTDPRSFFVADSDKYLLSLKSHPRAGMMKERLYIRVIHDYVQFWGYFESFDVIESADNPFSMKYNVSFKAERTEWL